MIYPLDSAIQCLNNQGQMNNIISLRNRHFNLYLYMLWVVICWVWHSSWTINMIWPNNWLPGFQKTKLSALNWIQSPQYKHGNIFIIKPSKIVVWTVEGWSMAYKSQTEKNRALNLIPNIQRCRYCPILTQAINETGTVLVDCPQSPVS